ncbi:MAG: hypothetical protein IIV91_05500 [Alistipes sp.]|nr:hypothetical protein [Alistipes sp.]
MKKFITLCIGILFSASLYAQNRVYCEIVERAIPLSKNKKITIDFGQKREKAMSQQSLVDENGENLIFNSKIDALNHMNKLGWEFLQAYTVVSGSNGDSKSCIHWLLYKDVKSGEDPYNGLTTKEIHKKSKQ